MKKIITSFFIIVLATCFVISCEKDNTQNDTPNPPTTISGPFSGANGRTLYFAKGNLYKENGIYKIYTNQYDYVNSTKLDERAGVDLFYWTENDGLNNTFSINGTDWEVPSLDDWRSILLNPTRPGSTVNGTANCIFAKTKIDNLKGLLLCPDNVTLNNAPQINLWNNDSAVYYNPISLEDWQIYDDAGFVFLPSAGVNFPDTIYGLGMDGSYWSSKIKNDTVYSIWIDKYHIALGFGPMNYGFSIRLVQVR